jgi:hypothetical protein
LYLVTITHLLALLVVSDRRTPSSVLSGLPRLV